MRCRGSAMRGRPERGAAGDPGEDRTARGAARLAAAVAVILVAALRPGPVVGQEELDVPAMAESPRQFHLSATMGALSWSDGPGPAVDGSALFGLDVERLLTPYASVRLAGAHGSTSATGPDGTAGVNVVLFELGVTGRVAVSSLRRAGVVPFVSAGIGSIVFDPEAEDLTTRSQNALSYGAGVEARPMRRIGFRAEWKHYDARLENLFDPTDRTGSTRDADRFQASVFWTF